MNSAKTVWLLLLILIIATFFRAYHLKTTPPALYIDEAFNGNNATEALRTNTFRVFYTDNFGREGLFINIQALFLKFFGAHEAWVLRLPSAIFGILTVLGIYFLAAELFTPLVGLFSSFFLATSVWHIIFSRIGFRAIMAPLLIVWALYFLLRAIRKDSRWLAALAGIIYGLGFYTYIAYRVTPLLLLLLIPFFKNTLNFKRNALMFLTGTFIVALPIGIYFLMNPADFFGRTSAISIFNSESPLRDLGMNIVKTLGMFNVYGDPNWRHNVSGSPQLFLPVGIAFLAGIAYLIRNRGFASYFIFLWCALAALPVVVSSEGLPHALRALLLIPPAFIFAGVGASRMYEYMREKVTERELRLILATFLAVVLVGAYYSYFVRWAKHPSVAGAFDEEFYLLGKELNTVPRETPKYVIVEDSNFVADVWDPFAQKVRGGRLANQTVVFLTDTQTPESQKDKQLYYVLKAEEGLIPPGAAVFYTK